MKAAEEATPAEVDAAVRAAHSAGHALADYPLRTAVLNAMAEELEAAREELVAAAAAETALGEDRLNGEIDRAAGQLRAFADEVADGGFLGIAIDHADPALTPPRPDLRRYKVPLGVVAVYAASNFPFAFSVPGGDTASALAAGCPVVVKTHPGHPATSELCALALQTALKKTGLPEAAVRVIHGFEAGVELIRHPLVAAAGFTGSVRGGRALYDAAAARPTPIPFHGELGSLNPVVVTAAAAEERGEEIGRQLAGSVTLGMGQFCVKPGLVLVPDGEAGQRLHEALADSLKSAVPGPLLGTRIRESFLAGVSARAAIDGVGAPVTAGPGAEGTQDVVPGFLTVPATKLAGESAALLEECFGPVTVLARYTDESELFSVLSLLQGSLTATVHLSSAEAREESGTGASLLSSLTPLAGRVLVDGWPTGVAVTTAQHHGGPYPATTSTSTSVGVTAVERWLRPVAYQNTPEALLPGELREDNPLGLPRRVDGHRSG